MMHACYLLFILCLCMSVKSSTELMLYVVLTIPTLNKAYLFIYLFVHYGAKNPNNQPVSLTCPFLVANWFFLTFIHNNGMI
jgi:hypothetical protein